MNHRENTLEDVHFFLSSFFGSIYALLPSGVSISPPPTKTSQTKPEIRKSKRERVYRMVVVLSTSLCEIERGGIGAKKRRQQKMWPSLYISSADRLQIIHYTVDINRLFVLFQGSEFEFFHENLVE
jgi:hypothetical protein